MISILDSTLVTRPARWLCSVALCVGLAVAGGAAGCGSESGDETNEDGTDVDVDPGDKADMSRYPSGKYANSWIASHMPERPYEMENGDLLIVSFNPGKKCVFKAFKDGMVDKEGTYAFSASKTRRYFRLVVDGKTFAKYEYKIESPIIRVRNILSKDWFKMPSIPKEGVCFTDSDCTTGETCTPGVTFQCPEGTTCSAPYTTLGMCKVSNCPKDLRAARGTDCPTEGEECNSGCTDHCKYCASLACSEGKWQFMEIFPDPKCREEAGNGCPSDFNSANGGSCSEEGRSCGECSDSCHFCTQLVCSEGVWGKIEFAPDPNCKKEAGCPSDVNSSVGTSCSEEGKSCGNCTDHCRFCMKLICSEGVWGKMELAPDPNCRRNSPEGCPTDWQSAEGSDCSTDGLSCGECPDKCQYCSTLTCSDGKWFRMEAFPDPNCR